MTNQEKAKQFLLMKSFGDKRCGVLLMMLMIAYSISERECLGRIQKIADGD